jgi:hypothetical protein
MENELIEWFGRLDGPLNLRLLLQPTIAAVLGYRDGVRDAASGALPYFWKIAHSEREERRTLAQNGWASIGKVFVIAIILDSIFQVLVTGRVAIVGAIVVATILAILPYLLLRGVVNRWKSHSTN